MFHDKKFKLNYAVDKRGRPISHSTTEDLKRFYDLSDSDSDLSDEESKVLDEKRVKEKKKQTKKETKSKTLIEEKKKETKKTDQKDSINKNDLNNSERIQKMKNSHKSPKIDSEVSPKDSEESLQSRKKKRDTTDLSVEASPKGKLRTKDPSTSAMVKSSTVSGSKAKREKQAVIMAKDNAGRMLHEEAPEEDSDSASELGRDEESEGEITSDDRASADDDENEDEEEEEDGEEEEEEEEGEESSQANWPLSLSFWEKRHWEEALFKLHLVHPFLIISTPNILRPSLGTDYKSKYVIIYYVSRTLNRQLGGLLRLHHFIFIYNAPC